MLNTILGSCGFMSVFILSHLFAFVKSVSKIFLIFCLYLLMMDKITFSDFWTQM